MNFLNVHKKIEVNQKRLLRRYFKVHNTNSKFFLRLLLNILNFYILIIWKRDSFFTYDRNNLTEKDVNFVINLILNFVKGFCTTLKRDIFDSFLTEHCFLKYLE